MKKLVLSVLFLLIGAIFANDLLAYTNEVRQSGDTYIWRINDVDQGSTTSFTEAVQNAVWSVPPIDYRELHILCSGTLTETIGLPYGIKLYCHNNTFTIDHGGYGFYGKGVNEVQIHDVTLSNLTNMGIRMTRCSNLVFDNITLLSGFIGMRIDSHESRPYEDFWVYNVTVTNCRFENLGSHGLETYGVDGCNIQNIVALNCGECGVLLNKTINGTVGTVDAYRCCVGGGYAGLRLANSCSNLAIDQLYARECGRGFFVTSGSNNCHLNYCYVVDCVDYWGEGRGVWLENVAYCSVESGCCNTGITAWGEGTYANIDSTCMELFNGTYNIIAQHSGKAIATSGFGTTNGTSIIQWSNTGDDAQRYIITPVDGEWHRITPVIATDQALDVTGVSTANSAHIITWAYHGGYNQQFKFQRASTGGWNIIVRHSGKCLDVEFASSLDGANIIQYDCTGNLNQVFSLTRLKSASIQSKEAMKEVASDFKLDVYPNPVTDNKIQLSMEIPEASEVQVKLYSVQGQLLFNRSLGVVEAGNTEQTIQFNETAKGIYTLRVETTQGVETRNVIFK
ncbi:MAG: RICIN domain-containing protein [Marinilabiliaceae bacterium]|nr:RICIN domain-containing protein [Marinilabiliaceae bacterium]MBN2819112.1 RICIN domain-containing protein [Bacteroidales bacterium]